MCDCHPLLLTKSIYIKNKFNELEDWNSIYVAYQSFTEIRIKAHKQYILSLQTLLSIPGHVPYLLIYSLMSALVMIKTSTSNNDLILLEQRGQLTHSAIQS